MPAAASGEGSGAADQHVVGKGPSTASPSSLLRSFSIFNPTFSKGKEERAMDNIIFFYPPACEPNRQMNTIGFATAVSAILDRFSDGDAEEICTDKCNYTLFTPIRDFWIMMETGILFDAGVVKPLLRRAFDSFLVRYGLRAFIHGMGEGQGAILEFFTSFCVFCEKHVLYGAPPASAVSWRKAGDGGATSGAGGSGGKGESSEIDSAARCGADALPPVVCAAEGLLGFPLQHGASAIGTQLSFSCAATERVHAALGADSEPRFAIFSNSFRLIGAAGLDTRVLGALQLLLYLESDLVTFVAHYQFPTANVGLDDGVGDDGAGSSAASPVLPCTVARSNDVTVMLLTAEPSHRAAERVTQAIADDVTRAIDASLGPSTSLVAPLPSYGAAMASPTVATYHVVQWYSGVALGAFLHSLPRLVHWSLSFHMREAQKFTMCEFWTSVNADTWIVVAHRFGRVVGIVFHNANQLADCLELGSRVLSKLYFMSSIHGSDCGTPHLHDGAKE